MGKWKPWQLVFLAYLLLLNFVVFCVLSFFLLNNTNTLINPFSEPQLAVAPAAQNSPAPVIPTATPLPETGTSTPVPIIIPSVNIPPVPPPQSVAAAPAHTPSPNNPPGDDSTRQPQAQPDASQPEASPVAGPQTGADAATPSSTPQPIAMSAELDTSTATNTPTATDTSTPLPTATPTFTPSASPTATRTPTATATHTPSPTATDTATPKPSPTPSATATATSTSTPTPKPSATSTATSRPTATSTPTATPKPSATATHTATRAPTATVTRTPTPSPTKTATPTASATATTRPSPTPTATARPRETTAPASVAMAPPNDSAPQQPDLARASSATLNATALTNGSIALSWETEADASPEYHLYSDMGSGYDVYILKAKTSQPAFIDKQLRPSLNYSYRLARVEAQQEIVLARTSAATFDQRSAQNADSISTQNDVSTASVVTALPTALPPDAVLLGLISDNNYTDDFDTLTIVGEVRNDSNLTVGQTDITVTFYDSAGVVIDTVNGKTLIDVILPGEKSPFVITLKRPAGLSSHSLRAVARPVPAEQAAQLTVVESRRFEDEAGFFHVKGRIENAGSTIARRIKVATVIYDRSNRVINVGFTYTDPPNLRPGQQAAYDVIFSYYPRYVTQQVIPFEE